MRQHRWQKSESGEGFSEDVFGQGGECQQQGIEERQQSEAGNCLHHAGDGQQGAAQKWSMPRCDGDRQAHPKSDGERGQAHQHVVAEIVGQTRPRVGETGIEDHRSNDGMGGEGAEPVIPGLARPSLWSR